MASMTPRYPSPGARGLKVLGGDREKGPKVGQITDLNPETWKSVLTTILGCGCGLLLSPTSDGGAVSLTLYYGDERAKGYASSKEDLEELLAAASDQAEAHEVGSALGSKRKAPVRP